MRAGLLEAEGVRLALFDRRFAVALDDHRLTWPERELVRQLGEKLYGPAAAGREVQR